MSKNKMPHGMSVIYFDGAKENFHAEMPANKELAKSLARRLAKDAMQDLSAENSRISTQEQIPLDNNTQTD